MGLAILTSAWAACAGQPGAPSRTLTFFGPNHPPVIHSISVPTSKVEVDQDVAISAVVDAPSVPDGQLTFSWMTKTGQITGTGPNVTWRLPKGRAATPVDVAVELVVTERYQVVGADGHVLPMETQATLDAPLFRVHDSSAELTKMAVTFLVDYFGNSAVSPDACLVDFSDTCPGKNDERRDIQENRRDFVILSASASVSSVAFNGSRTFADVLAPCTFRSREIATGHVGTVTGDCTLTSVYETRRWWLCDSHFINGHVIEGAVPDLVRRFFGGGRGATGDAFQNRQAPTNACSISTAAR